jgi:hypothetical protein
MKHFVLTSCFCFFISILSFSQIADSQRFFIEEYTFRDTIVSDNKAYTLIAKNQPDYSNTPGSPRLPVQNKKYILPYGCRIDSILTIVNAADTVFLRNLPFPVPPMLSGNTCAMPHDPGIDSAVYYSQTPYPVSCIEFAGQGLWNNANIATLSIYPFQYLPSINAFVFFDDIRYSIYYSNPSGANPIPDTIKMKPHYFAAYFNKLRESISNQAEINNLVRNVIITENSADSIGNLPVADYLVIAPNKYIDSQPVKDFVLWKKKCGVDIEKISLEAITGFGSPYYEKDDDIGNTGTKPNTQVINDAAAWLRLYLRDVHADGGANWILLIGDENEMPIRRFKPFAGEYGNEEPVSDKYFADYTSDYAVDGDSFWGEFSVVTGGNNGDNVDVYPESYVARIPCSDVSELSVWVNKLHNYEINPGNGSSSYLGSIVLNMADEFQKELQNNTDLFSNLSMFNILNLKELPDYDSPEPSAPLGSAIIQSISTNPCGWWIWSNHGQETAFNAKTHGTNGSNFLQDQVTTGSGSNGLLSLTNTSKYSIIHSGCCDVASFCKPSSCMAEECLFNPAGGSVAFSGCTDMSWIPLEDAKLLILSEKLNLCHSGTEKINQHLCELDWNTYSYSGMLNSSQFETYMVHNLFADPAMMYFTKNPERIIASVNMHHIDKTALNLIQINTLNISSGDSITLCLYKQKVSGETNPMPEYQNSITIAGTQGNEITTFQIPADSLDKGILYLTISGFNYLPYTDTIIVSPGCTKQPDTLSIVTTPAFPWFGERFINQDIRIKNGATLTIKGNLYFVPGSKLIVEQGGRLIIDGGKLAASCEDFWSGIEVWGSNGKMQNILNQGSISVINNGSICDAICGIRAVKLSGISAVPGTSGGVIWCENARFVNNKLAVKFYPFYFQGHGYNSGFTNTHFELNEKYIGSNAPAEGLVNMSDMFGISFRGCIFENSNTMQTNIRARGYGIKTSNAGFSVDSRQNANTIPDTASIPCMFTGLTYGIHAGNYGALYPVTIQNSGFSNNYRAVYLSAVNLPRIHRNRFNLLRGSSADTTSGLYLNACTGYSVQENTFEGHYSGTNTCETGIVINNSGTAPNEIYNNTFTGLQNGILAQNQNRDGTGQNGLVIKCNDFIPDLKYDIAVTKNESGTSMGISKFQGINGTQTTDPAGNTFSYTHQNSESDYHNECENITYIYHAVANGAYVNPVNHTPIPVVGPIPSQFSISYLKAASCPSKLDNGGGGISQLKMQQDNAEALISGYTGQMLSLKDGGNTQDLKDDIAYSIPPEALALYNSLMAKSPYLSDTVLTEAIGKEDVLPSAMVTDILVANPQSAKSSEIIEALDNRTNLLSDEQREDVDQGVFVLSAFESLQSKIGDALAQRAHVQYAIVNQYINDSTGTDSLKLYLSAQPDLWAKQVLLNQYVTESDTVSADGLMQSINSSCLNPTQQDQWNDLITFYGICTQMKAQANDLPDSIQQTILNELATHNTYSGTYARDLLINKDIIAYNEPYIFPENNLKSGKIIRNKQVTTRINADFKIYPNPAIDYVIIEYTGEKSNRFLSIEIIDAAGQIILKHNFEETSDIQVIPLSGVAPGAYTIHIIRDIWPHSNSKLIILH